MSHKFSTVLSVMQSDLFIGRNWAVAAIRRENMWEPDKLFSINTKAANNLCSCKTY